MFIKMSFKGVGDTFIYLCPHNTMLLLMTLPFMVKGQRRTEEFKTDKTPAVIGFSPQFQKVLYRDLEIPR